MVQIPPPLFKKKMINEILATILKYLSLSWKIFITPWLNFETLWIILPLILILILIHLYFGRYRTEQLGWNSAFSNSISLLWICAILFRFLLEKNNLSITQILSQQRSLESLIIISILFIGVLFLLILNFFHTMPKKIAYLISSANFTYVLAYIIISVIIGGFLLNIETLISSIIVFILIIIFLQIIKHIIPMTKSARQIMDKKEEKEVRIKAGKKAAKTRKKNNNYNKK